MNHDNHKNDTNQSHMNHQHSDEHTHHHEDHMNHNHHEMYDMDHSMHTGNKQSHEGHMNHDHHEMGGVDHSMHMGNFKQKFWLSLILAIPIIVLSPMMGMELPFQFTFPGSEWVVLVLATILFFYGGQPFLSGAKMELQQKNPAMMTLISMGISVSYIYSIYSFIANNFLHQHVMDFFWELATLIIIMLLGHWIEMNAVSNASDALKKIGRTTP